MSRSSVYYRPKGASEEAMSEAMDRGRPKVFNTDQGSQFSSQEFTQVLQDHGVKISMYGKGMYADNIFVERLWRTVKYEEVYLKAIANSREALRETGSLFPVLQGPEAPSGPEVPDPGRSAPRRAGSPEGRIKGDEVRAGSSLGIIGRNGRTLT